MAAGKKPTSKDLLGRDKKFAIGCINLVLHPHSAEKYIQLLTVIKEQRLAVKVRGDEAIMIGTLTKSDSEGEYVGEIYRYLNLDTNADWFNVQSMKAATKNDVKAVVIPENLKPHFKKFSFVFFTKRHRFFYVSKSGGDTLPPRMLEKFFKVVAESSHLSRFGSFKPTAQPRLGSSDQLFSLPRISRVQMEIHRPNPDDHEDLELEFEERLRELNAKKEIRIYVEENSEGIQPDDKFKALAQVAASNGKVLVHGRNSRNEVVDLSTKDMPLTESVSYNPDVQTERDALVEAARGLRQGL